MSRTTPLSETAVSRRVTPGEPNGKVRWHRLLHLAPWLVVVAFAVVTLWPLATGHVFLGTDILSRFRPWGSSGAESVTNPWVGDTVDSVSAQTIVIRDSLPGSLQQWNPYISGGSPLASLPNLAPYSPLTLVSYLVPFWAASGVIKLLEIVVVSVGMALFLRRLHVNTLGQALASLTYLSCGFTVAWTNWPQTRVAAFIPLLFWAVDGAVVERGWRWSVAVACALAAMVLGGFPAVTGYAVYAVTAWGGLRLVATSPRVRSVLRGISVAATGYVLGIALAAFQVLPFVDESLFAIDFDSRVQDPSMHLDWSALATSIVPSMFEEPSDTSWAPGANPIENFSFLGIVPVLLAFVAIFATGRIRGMPIEWATGYLWVLALLSCLAVYRGGAFLGLLQRLPVFSNNPTPRLRVMIGFAVAVLAGIGASWLWQRHGRMVSDLLRSPLSSGVRAAISLTLLVGLLVLVRRAQLLADPEHAAAAHTATLTAAGLCVLVAVLLFAMGLLRSTRLRAIVTTLLCALACGQALSVTTSWWPSPPRSTLYPVTSTHSFLQEHLGHDRYVGAQTMSPGTASAYGLRSVEGHVAHAPSWRAVLQAIEPAVMVTPTYSEFGAATLDQWATSPLLDRLAARYVVVSPDEPVLGTDVAPVAADSVVTLAPDTAAPLALPDSPASLRAVVVTLAAETTASPTLVVMSPEGSLGSQDVASGTAAGERVQIPIVTTGTTSSLTLVSSETLELAGHGDAVAAGLVVATEDGLKIVLADPTSVIYERTSSLPRIRWSDQIAVEDREGTALALLGSGLDPGTTLLAETTGGMVPVGGGTAYLTITEDNGDRIAVTVEASSDGWLTVADAMQRTGWHVSVDGNEAALVPSDVAGVAVYVPSGDHDVQFWYNAPGRTAGTAISVVALVVCAGIIALHAVRRTQQSIEVEAR